MSGTNGTIIHGSTKHDLSVLAAGTYTGDNTNGRAIAHSMGKVPKLIIVFPLTGAIGAGEWVSGMGAMWTAIATDQLYNLGAAPDVTNFYVGDAVAHLGNFTGVVYYWVAL